MFEQLLENPFPSEENSKGKWQNICGAGNIPLTGGSLPADYHDRVYLPSQKGGVDANEYLYRYVKLLLDSQCQSWLSNY